VFLIVRVRVAIKLKIIARLILLCHQLLFVLISFVLFIARYAHAVRYSQEIVNSYEDPYIFCSSRFRKTEIVLTKSSWI